MLTEVFYNDILNENIKSNCQLEDNINIEEQKEIIYNVLYKNDIKKLARTNKIKALIKNYEILYDSAEENDLKVECENMIKYLRDYYKKTNKIYISSYKEFYNHILNVSNTFENLYAIYNTMAILLLAYEGIKDDDDLINISINNFKSGFKKKKPEFWIDIKNSDNSIKCIPIHKETYNFIMEYSKKYELKYETIDCNGRKKAYRYYPFLTETRKYSIFKTAVEDNVLSLEKMLNLRKGIKRFFKDFEINPTTAYNYGRFEWIFELEIMYENPESISDKLPTKLFECVINYCWGDVDERTVLSFHKEYIEWRKKKFTI